MPLVADLIMLVHHLSALVFLKYIEYVSGSNNCFGVTSLKAPSISKKVAKVYFFGSIDLSMSPTFECRAESVDVTCDILLKAPDMDPGHAYFTSGLYEFITESG